MSDPSEKCPVCLAHTEHETLCSEGIVVGAAQALIDGDGPTVQTYFDNATAYDFHVAVTMFVNLVCEVASVHGFSPKQYFETYREQINHDVLGH